MSAHPRTDIEQFLADMTPRLRGYLTMMMPGTMDAEDVMQDVFLTYARRGPAPATPHAERWLFRACRNRALNVLRSGKRRKQREEHYVDREVAAPPSPADHAQAQDEASRIRAAMQRIEEPLRELLYLKVVDGLPLREISSRVGMPKSTVALRVTEALVRLNRYFHEEE